MATTSFLNAKIIGDRVALLYRDAEGTLKQKSVQAEWVSYHDAILDPDPANDARIQRAFRQDRRVVAVQREGDYLRVRWRGKWERKEACRAMREHGVRVYEGDVNPIRRLYSDLGLGIARQRWLKFDIEVDSRLNFKEQRAGKARVLSWCARDQDGNRFVAILQEWSDAAERRLLEAFWELAERYDGLIAWSGRHGTETYDFVVLQGRSDLVGAAPSDYERWNWLDHHDVFERMNKNAAESGAEKRSLKLQAVAMELLKVGKEDFDSGKTYDGWLWAFENGLTFGEVRTYSLRDSDCDEMIAALCPLLRYNVHDVDLMEGIEQKTGYIALFETICEICRLFPNSYALYPTVQMDGFLLRLGVERGYHFPTKWYDKEEDAHPHEQFEGAYVLHPTKAGVIEDVHVGDFASMYPSIVISFNISLETCLGRHAPDQRPPNSCYAPGTGVCFSTERMGILPFAMLTLLQQRDHYRRLKSKCAPGTPEWWDAERKSSAFKVAANSFFGASGNRYCRYYLVEVAESISATGGWLSRSTLEQAATDAWRIEPIYGDTDAAMVVGVTRERFVEFVDWCNDTYYPSVVERFGGMVVEGFGRLKFENEKGYRRIVFVKKNDGTPASKKYVGVFSYYKGADADENSKPEVKGLEWRRGDSNVMTAALQWDAIEAFWKGDWKAVDPYLAAVQRWRAKVLEGDLTIDEVKVSKSLSKPIAEYVVKKKKDGNDGAQPEHVRVAKVLLARGQEVGEGTRVEYFMRDHALRDVQPAEDYRGDVDRPYLWEDKIYPPTQRLLEAIHPGHDWKAYRRARPEKPRAARKAPTRRNVAVFRGTVLNGDFGEVALTAEIVPPPPSRPRKRGIRIPL